MDTYLFVSLTTPGVSALTDSPVGRRLPAEYGPWQFREPVVVPDSDANSEIVTSIERDGFYLINAVSRRAHRREFP